jgi:hypothetical protein
MSDKTCPHCGKMISKPRSVEDHRRLFAAIAAAHAQWPEAHEFQPDNAEHLRAWLTCKAGYRETTVLRLPGSLSEQMQLLFRLGIEAALAGGRGPAFVVPIEGGVAVVRPKSISFSTLGQSAFAEVRSAIEDVIAAETGLQPDDLLRGALAA